MTRTGNPTILFVDDADDGVMDILRQWVTKYGHPTLQAEALDDALDALADAAVGIVLVDASWFVGVRSDALADLHAAARSHVRFVILNGMANPPFMQHYSPRTDRILTKPFTLRAAMDTIRKANRRRYQPDIQSRGLPA